MASVSSAIVLKKKLHWSIFRHTTTSATDAWICKLVYVVHPVPIRLRITSISVSPTLRQAVPMFWVCFLIFFLWMHN